MDCLPIPHWKASALCIPRATHFIIRERENEPRDLTTKQQQQPPHNAIICIVGALHGQFKSISLDRLAGQNYRTQHNCAIALCAAQWQTTVNNRLITLQHLLDCPSVGAIGARVEAIRPNTAAWRLLWHVVSPNERRPPRTAHFVWTTRTFRTRKSAANARDNWTTVKWWLSWGGLWWKHCFWIVCSKHGVAKCNWMGGVSGLPRLW